VAFAPEFTHRWFSPDKFSAEALKDGNLFPLLSDSYRMEAAMASVRVAQFCVEKFSVRAPQRPAVVDESAANAADAAVNEELIMAKIHAMNAINEHNPGFTSFDSLIDEVMTPPNRLNKLTSPSVVNFNQPGLEKGNRLLAMIEPLLPRDAFEECKLWMLERFAASDFRVLDAADAVQVLQELPAEIRDRAVLGAGVTRLDDTGEFVL
jgi:hypothetical protein